MTEEMSNDELINALREHVIELEMAVEEAHMERDDAVDRLKAHEYVMRKKGFVAKNAEEALFVLGKMENRYSKPERGVEPLYDGDKVHNGLRFVEMGGSRVYHYGAEG